MALLTISDLLRKAGLDTTKKIKLVRHKDSRQEIHIGGKLVKGNPFDWYVNHRDWFISYQAEQESDRFKGAEYVVSFVGEEGTTARLVGVYRVLGLDREKMARINNGHFFYQLEEVNNPGLEELNQRVIIDWLNGAIHWHQWLGEKSDMPVIALEKKGIDWYCPPYERILLSYEKLRRIFEDDISIWHTKLSDCNCIYAISDSKTGKLYIGSTYNRSGIWGRWKDYAKTGHGDDVELVKLLKADPDYAKKYFTWSILQVLPLSIQDVKAIEIETLWKNKLGRAACTLNRN